MAVVPDLSRMRRDYGGRGLREEDLAGGWVELFDRWFADAVAAELPEPNAMVVATADTDGVPDARIVLMKGYDAFGFVFVTSYASAKGAQLAVNPHAALVFPWHALQRQVRFAGRVERVGDAAVAQRAAVLVRFGDLRLEGDHALQAGYEVVGHLACSSAGDTCAHRMRAA